MRRIKSLGAGLLALAIAGGAWALPVMGVSYGNGPTRLRACQAALEDASRASDSAARQAQRDLGERRTLVSAEVSPCECEEDPAVTPNTLMRWRCMTTWRLVGAPDRVR